MVDDEHDALREWDNGDIPDTLVVDVDGLGGGSGDELRGGLGPGELDTRTVMTFIYLEVL